MDWIPLEVIDEVKKDFVEWYIENIGGEKEACILGEKWESLVKKKAELFELELKLREDAELEEERKEKRRIQWSYDRANEILAEKGCVRFAKVWHWVMRDEEYTYCGLKMKEGGERKRWNEELQICKKCSNTHNLHDWELCTLSEELLAGEIEGEVFIDEEEK